MSRDILQDLRQLIRSVRILLLGIIGIGSARDDTVESDHRPVPLGPGGFDPLNYLGYGSGAVSFHAAYVIGAGRKLVIFPRVMTFRTKW